MVVIILLLIIMPAWLLRRGVHGPRAQPRRPGDGGRSGVVIVLLVM